MTNYYHTFAASFNAWYLLVPALVVLAGVIGNARWTTGRHGCPKARYNRRTFTVIEAVVGISTVVMVMVESWFGILQAVMNVWLIPGEEPDSAIAVALIVVVALGIVAGKLAGRIARTMAARQHRKLMGRERARIGFEKSTLRT